MIGYMYFLPIIYNFAIYPRPSGKNKVSYQANAVQNIAPLGI